MADILRRWSPRLLALGAAIWVLSWLFNEQTVDGSVAVLGLSEQGWRRLLDPGTLCLMGGFYGLHLRKRDRYGKLGSTAHVIVQIGLVLALIGNVIEFWIGEWLYVDIPGEFEPTDHIGWAIFGFGTVIGALGVLLVAVALFRRPPDAAEMRTPEPGESVTEVGED